MENKKLFWDIKVYIKNFAALTAMDSHTYQMMSYEDDYIVYRRGKFNKSDIDMSNIDRFMFYNMKYIDIIPQTNEAEMVNMMEWFQYKKSIAYSILIKKHKNNILEGTLRFYSLDDAYKFRMHFNDYIVFENKNISTLIG